MMLHTLVLLPMQTRVAMRVVLLQFILLLASTLQSGSALPKENHILCRVSMVFVTTGTTTSSFQQSTERYFSCDTFFTPNPKSDSLPPIVSLDPSNETLRANQEALLKDEWYISFPSSWLLPTDLPTPTLIFPPGEQIVTVEPAIVDRLLQKPSGLRKHRRQQRTRRTRETKPEESVLVVLVSAKNTDLNVTTSEAQDVVFGNENADQVSAASQFSACSFGQFQLVPFGENPVISVRVDDNIDQYDKITIRAEAQKKVCAEFGLRTRCSPDDSKGIDHIIYVVPFGLSSDNNPHGFGSAAVGGTHSVYQGKAFAPESILHEFGHNFRLGHAGEGNYKYGDITGQMGNNFFQMTPNGNSRCFNGWNM